MWGIDPGWFLTPDQVPMRRPSKITLRSTFAETLKDLVNIYTLTLKFEGNQSSPHPSWDVSDSQWNAVNSDHVLFLPQTSTRAVERRVTWSEAFVNSSRARSQPSSPVTWAQCWQSMPRTPGKTGSTKMLPFTWSHRWHPKHRHRRYCPLVLFDQPGHYCGLFTVWMAPVVKVCVIFSTSMESLKRTSWSIWRSSSWTTFSQT